MAVDLIADAFNKLKLYDRQGKQECTLKYSKLLMAILEQLKKHGYVESFDYEDNLKGGLIHVKLKGKIKELGVIKPMKPVKGSEWIVTEARYLPAVGYGRLIVTTSKGVLTNEEAKEMRIGGRLIGFVY